jgi:DNA polymerase
VALGKFAAHFLCGETTPITRLRGNLRTFHEIPVMPTYHPAFLLRDASRKGEAWADLKQVMALLNNMGLRWGSHGPDLQLRSGLSLIDTRDRQR